jgi:outer membrane lipoprotein-sorting protein
MRRGLFALQLGLPTGKPLTATAMAAGYVAAAVLLAPSLAAAQDSGTTVVAKTPAPTRPNAVGIPAAGTQSAESTAPELKPAQDMSGSSAAAPQTTGSVQPNQPLPPPPVTASAPAGNINNSSADEGAGWEAAVTAAPGPTPLIGPARDEAVNKVNAYFNSMDSMQGTFTQVDSDDKVTTGRFYVEKPGKLRFDYAPPSPLRIVSDGAFLSIEDSDLKTVEKYPIDSTPFRLLLAKDVDLTRDSRVIGVDRGDGQLSVTVEDKNDAGSGSIKLVFDTTGPEMTLSQWVITDAQGLTTTVSLDNVGPGRKVAADFFQSRQSFDPFR